MPVNIHLTGCHHSCAQHYIGDIGLIGAKVAVGDDGDTVEGYDIVVGGGFAENARIGRELWKGIRGGGLSRPHRGAAAGLFGAPARARGELSGLHAAARDRRAAFHCLSLKSAEGRPGEGEISASPVRAVAA